MPPVRPDAWRPSGVENLEPNAWRALREEGSVCVVAGPGAGKTEFLAQRAAYLLETGLCPSPRRILAISFKRDAARNLGDRVRRRCSPELAGRLVSQTFDAFAKGLVDRFWVLIPAEWRPTYPYVIPPFFPRRQIEGVLDEARQTVPRPEWQAEVAQIGAKDFEARWLGRMSLPKAGAEGSNGYQWALLRWWRGSLRAVGGSQLSFVMISRLAELLLRTNPTLTAALRLTYPFVFLDEFQDATYAQYALLLAAFGGGGATRLTAVGDDKQRIMAWAGARPDAFARFEQDFGARRIPLLSNFRSSPALVRIQHVVAQAIEADAPVAVSQAEATIDEDAAQVWRFAEQSAEASHLASWIARDLRHRRLAPRDYGLLVRQRCDELEDRLAGSFSAHGLRLRNESRLVGGRVSLQDLMAEEYAAIAGSLLRSAAGGARRPDAWVASRDALRWLRAADPDDEAACARVEDELRGFVVQLRRKMSVPPTPELGSSCAADVLAFLDPTDLRRGVRQYAAGDLLDTVAETYALHLAASCEGAADWATALDACEGVGQVPLMTVHKSKGLEYHTVVFLGLDDEQWWSYSAANPEGLATFFVALSRAKQRAIFTFCAGRGRQKIARLYDLLATAGVAEVDLSRSGGSERWSFPGPELLGSRP